MTARPAAVAVVPVLPAVLAAGAAGLAFDGAFPLRTLVPLCCASAAIPGLVTALSAVAARWWPTVSRALAVPVSLLVWAVALPVPARALAAPGTGPTGWWAMLRRLPDGPYQVLASSLPAPATPPLLLFVGTAVWWAALCAGELAARGGGAGSPAHGALATMTAPVLVLAAGTSASVHVGSPAGVPAAAAVAGLGVLLLAGRRTAGAVLTAAAVTAAAGLLVPVLPGLASRPAADPRRLVHPPPTTSPPTSPLSQVAAWVSGPARPLFTVRTGTPANTRWLVLDRYDGAGWASSALYRPAGADLPTGGAGGPTATVTQRIELQHLPGPWLPAAAAPRRVTGVQVAVDPDLGVLATGDARAAGHTGYTAVSATPRPTVDRLAAASPGRGGRLEADLAVPAGMPPGLANLGRLAMAGAAYPYQQLVLLQNWLRSTLNYDVTAFPGQGYGNLALVVSATHAGGQDVFATLFAVLARAAGFPTRIAVGFGPGHRIRGTADRYQVTTADALVWPEVYLTGLGWTPFYPVPARHATAGDETVPSAVGEPTQQASLDQKVTGNHGGATRTRPGAHASVRVTRPPAKHHWTAIGLLAGVAVAALAVGALVARSLARLGSRLARRRRRRRDPDPRHRTAGAWQDALESVHRRTGQHLDTCTASEVADLATTGLGPAADGPAHRLAVLAEIALYGPGFGVGAEDAAAAWHAADELRRLAGIRHRIGRRRQDGLAAGGSAAHTDGETVMPLSPDAGRTMVATRKQ
ncbi:MAG: transglutaminaseTgpA domain-containing protein [Mycobacteriales bacterium]